MEWSAHQLREAGTSPDEMLAEFEHAGLVAKSIPASGLLADAQALSPDVLRSTGYDNIILMKG